LYGEVGKRGGLTTSSLLDQLKNVDAEEDITFMVNSPGGAVDEGLFISSIIKQLPNKTEAYINGVAASIATVISLSADRTTMTPESTFMIHNSHIMMQANANEMKDRIKLLEDIDKSMVNMYAKKTGKGKKMIKALMYSETFMNASEALEMGFVDEIKEPMAIAAYFNLSNMNILEQIKNQAASLGLIESADEDQEAVNALAEAAEAKATEEVAAKVESAETPSDAFKADMVSAVEFKTYVNQTNALLAQLIKYLDKIPSEDERKAELKETVSAYNAELLAKVKSSGKPNMAADRLVKSEQEKGVTENPWAAGMDKIRNLNNLVNN
jgi:ATP-dependent protease ClpP protease subunit